MKTIELARFNTLLKFEDSFAFNHTLLSSGMAMCWTQQQWDQNTDIYDYIADSVEPMRPPCDTYSGAKARNPDDFDMEKRLDASGRASPRDRETGRTMRGNFEIGGS